MRKLFIPFLLLSTFTQAQSIELVSGSLENLKSQTSYNIKFTYNNMIVGTDTPEKEYLNQKKKEWEEKDPVKGEEFVKLWFADREEFYEPSFIKGFEKYGKVKLNNPNAPFTLVVKTKRTEGGWTLGVMNNPADIDGELWIIETANHKNVIAIISFLDQAGTDSHGGDILMTTRILSAYTIAGKALGDFLKRKSR